MPGCSRSSWRSTGSLAEVALFLDHDLSEAEGHRSHREWKVCRCWWFVRMTKDDALSLHWVPRQQHRQVARRCGVCPIVTKADLVSWAAKSASDNAVVEVERNPRHTLLCSMREA